MGSTDYIGSHPCGKCDGITCGDRYTVIMASVLVAEFERPGFSFENCQR